VTGVPRRAPIELAASCGVASSCYEVGVVVALGEREPHDHDWPALLRAIQKWPFTAHESREDGACHLHRERMFPSDPAGTLTR